ncbi:hypothetical protein GDO86_005266, partial [Hymenochirus boettgeri]
MDIQSYTKAWKWQVAYSFFLYSLGWVSGQLRYSIVEEFEPGTVVGNLAEDLGLNVADIYNRRLHLGSEGSRGYFSVNQRNGDLIVKETIDRENLCGSSTRCSLNVQVVAENPLELFSLEIDILDLNDNSPTFSTVDHILKITELLESPGARFSLETAQDADVGSNGITQYQINPNAFFSLSVKNRKDGVLIPELVLEKTLDREDKEEHILIITAFDGGKPPRSGSCQIKITVLDINDNPPVFQQPTYKINLLENPTLNTVILVLNATDMDDGSNGEIEYFFDQHTSISVRELFNLNPQTGEVSVNGVLDFEAVSFYEILFKAKDKGFPALEGRCIVQIEVEDANDNSPEITFTSVTNEIPENAGIGTVVGFLRVSDKDSGKNGEVQVKVNPSLPFEFKPLKDHYSLIVSGVLDREKISQYTVYLIAIDLGSPPLQTQTTLTVNISDINDNAPTFELPHYIAFIKENNEPGSFLCSVTAFDLDQGINSELSYFILDNQIYGSSVSSFVYINHKNGNIYAQRSFDYELNQVFQITVRAEDFGHPKLFSSASVTIFVQDVNDNSPTVLHPEYSKELLAYEKIPKSASAGFLVTKVSAVDLDSGHNAWLHFILKESNRLSLFHVSENTGEIRTIRSLQETDIIEQELIVIISDHGDPPLSITITILVNIVDSTAQEAPKNSEFLTKSKTSTDMTLYLIISLVAISIVSLITFIILLVKCIRKENLDSGSGCCFPNSLFLKNSKEQYQPTLYLNADGTLKYMEVRMVPPGSQGQCYQTCFPVGTDKQDGGFMKALNFPELKDMVNETGSSGTSWAHVEKE